MNFALDTKVFSQFAMMATALEEQLSSPRSHFFATMFFEAA